MPWTMPGMRAAMLGLHDQDIAAVPLGDDLVLQVLRRVLAAQVRLERAAQARALLAQPLADDLQLRAGVIDDVAGRVDLVARRGDLALERRRAAADGLEARERSGRAADGGARLVDRIEKRREREQPERLERPALDRRARAKICGRSSTRAAETHRSRRETAPLRSCARADRATVCGSSRRLQPRETLAAHRRQREGRDGLDDAIEFEGPQGAWLHR